MAKVASQEFAERAKAAFEGVPNVQVIVHDEGIVQSILTPSQYSLAPVKLGQLRKAW